MKLVIWTQVVDRNDPILGFFVSWLAEFATQFEQIDVICFSEGEHDLPAHVQIHTLGKASGAGKLRQVWLFYGHYRCALKQQPDYMLFHMGAIMNVLAAPFYFWGKIKRRRPKVLWWKTHGHINLLGRLALRCVDEVVTASKESFPIATPKRRVVGHAIDTDFFAAPATPAPPPPTILVVGRLMPRKQQLRALQVAHALQQRSVQFQMLLVGPETDATYVSQLRAYCEAHSLQESVHFTGSCTQAELRSRYQSAALLLNTSDTDSIDKVVLEAIACGVVSVTCTKAFAGMLSPSNLFFDKAAIEAMADRLQGLLTDQSERSRLSEQLRTVVVRNHALATLTDRIFV